MLARKPSLKLYPHSKAVTGPSKKLLVAATAVALLGVGVAGTSNAFAGSTPSGSADVNKLIVGAEVNGGSFGSDPISAFVQADNSMGPLQAHRTFSPGLPTSFKETPAASDAAHGYASVVSFKPPKGDFTGAANGKYDAQITAWAKSVPASADVYATMWHEPENDMNGAQYVAMEKHVYTVVKKANPKIKYGEIYMAYWHQVGSSHYKGPESAWFPGNAYSDFVAVDTYTHTPVTLANDAPFMDWYNQFKGVQEPMFITEYGRYVYSGTPNQAMLTKEAQVFAADAAWIKNSRISMWLVWDGVQQGGASWQLKGAAATEWKAIAKANS